MNQDNLAPVTSQEIYKQALQTALDEWMQLQAQERQITILKRQLKQTFVALFPLAYPEEPQPDLSSMSLANAIRLIIGSIDRPINAIELRGKLLDLGFDLSKYDNPLANIHTTMNRMVESDEMEWSNEEEKKVLAGPELKQVPTPEPAPSDDVLRNSIVNLLNALKANTGEGQK